MPDFPEILENPVPPVITTTDVLDAAAYIGIYAAGAWPAANRALFIPFSIDEQVTAYSLGLQTNTFSANLDMGIYDLYGTQLVHTGTQVGVGGYNNFNIADTILQPGYYYMAAVSDSVSGSIIRFNPSAQFLRSFGVREMATAFPLPSTATFANPTSAYAPLVAVHFASVV